LTTGVISGSVSIYAKANTAIQYLIGYASSGATAMQYELHIVVAGASVNASVVSTFNGRGGTVLPVSGDYTVSQVTGAAPTASPTFTGTITQTGTTIVTQTTGAFANNDVLTMRYMGAI